MPFPRVATHLGAARLGGELGLQQSPFSKHPTPQDPQNLHTVHSGDRLEVTGFENLRKEEPMSEELKC